MLAEDEELGRLRPQGPTAEEDEDEWGGGGESRQSYLMRDIHGQESLSRWTEEMEKVLAVARDASVG